MLHVLLYASHSYTAKAFAGPDAGVKYMVFWRSGAIEKWPDEPFEDKESGPSGT